MQRGHAGHDLNRRPMMRLRRLVVVVALGVALATSALLAQSPSQIQLFASVLDASGAPAKSMEIADVKLTEDDAEAKVTKVEPLNWPVKLQLLLDNGVGIGGANIQQLKNGVLGILAVLPENLEVTIVGTAPQPRFLARPTTDRAAMQKGLDLLSGDSGAGRFVESLAEATQRIERDKGDYFPVIISVGSTSGDRDVKDTDVERIMKRLEARPTIVHVVLFTGGPQSSGGGANQTNVGINVTKFTGGTYESINSATRIATLLAEIGKKVATAVERQSHQFRITAERPAGKKGDIGKVSMGTKAPLVTAGLSFDGRIR
jgi:hypothetical protein